MIKNAIPWKGELLRIQKRFKKQNLPKAWNNRQYFIYERDIFISFYVIRKLLESEQLSRRIREKQISLLKCSRSEKEISPIPEETQKDLQDRYSSPAKKETLPIKKVCDQLIHSYYFALAHHHSKPIGFAFCSDHKKDECLYVLRFGEISKLLQAVGTDYPKWLIRVFDEDKKKWKRIS